MGRGHGGTRSIGMGRGVKMSAEDRALLNAMSDEDKKIFQRLSKQEKKEWLEQEKNIKAWEKDFADRTSKPRTAIEKGSEAYKEAQKMSNIVFNNADHSWKGYSWASSMQKALDEGAWNDSAERVKFATDFVSKHGSDFEKSVAQSISKTIRFDGKGGRVAFVSQKQAWVMGKALSELHVTANDFPL